jgi:hypothetical protein
MKTDNQNQEPVDGDEPDLLFESGKNIVKTFISKGACLDNVLKIASEGTAFAEHIVAKMDAEWDNPPEMACKAGCPYCCSMQISITPPEAILHLMWVLVTSPVPVGSTATPGPPRPLSKYTIPVP